jgi:hypothetical protein
MARKGLAAVLGLTFWITLAAGAEAPPAITVRLVRPDVQCDRVIALFQGSRARHPAAALAAWKRATAPQGQLGKPLEAAITVFNPQTARELKRLDQARVVFSFDPEADGALEWYATLPRDDGTLAALATALALTDGGSDAPADGVAVDRLGPPGAPLLARTEERLALAGSRDALLAALAAAPAADRPDEPGLGAESGLMLRLDPAGLGQAGPVARRRLAEGLRALGCRDADAVAGLEGDAVGVTMRLALDPPPQRVPAAAIDPAWFDGLPVAPDQVLAAFAWAFQRTPEAWDRTFALLDRVERADPARAGVAPLRTRVNLLAAAVKVRPEVDLWPQLTGVSGVLLAGAAGRIGGCILLVHTTAPESAQRIVEKVLPPLMPLVGLRPEPAAEAQPGAARLLGRVRGRPLWLSQQGAAVRLSWGEPAAAWIGPAVSAPPLGPALRAVMPGGEPPQRFGVFWPGRLALEPTVGTPLATTLREAPPIVWSGRDVDTGTRDCVQWSGLRDLVRHFLDRIPLAPPPAP